MKDVRFSVVIPVYNSHHSIEEVVLRIIKTLESLDQTFEIILVDDLSKDNSLEKLKELNERDSRVHVIALQENHGQQGAIKIGMGASKGSFIITMDDDLEHQPEDLPLLISEINKGYDVVYGIPENKKYPFYRKLGSKLVDVFFTVGLNKPRNIKIGSYRMINRKTVDRILSDHTPFVYLTAITLKFTKNIGNVSVQHVERKYGKSNYNFVKLAKLFMKLFFYYRIAGKSKGLSSELT